MAAATYLEIAKNLLDVNDAAGEAWEEPIPFDSPDLSPFPIHVLPQWLRDLVVSLAVQSQVPVDLPALLSLSVVAIAGGKSHMIQARPGWIEPLNLYTMSILESGNRKTGTEKELLVPVYDFETKLIEEVTPIWQQAKHELDYKKAALEDLKKQYVKARNVGKKIDKDGKTTGRTVTEIKEDMDFLIKEIADTPEVFLPTILADDITMEKLVVLLSENNGSLGIFSAEGTLFGIAAGRYTGMASFDELLKAHSGDPLRADRIGRARVNVPNPALTIGMCVQPIVVQELAKNPVFRLKGLQARFLYAIPDSPLGEREANSTPIPENVKNAYYNAIRRLLSMAVNTKSKRVLCLSSDANELLAEFERWLEPQLAPDGKLRPIVDWAAKLAGALLRITGLLHLAEYYDEEHIPQKVSADTVARAIELQEFLISHARRVFDVMGMESAEFELCKKTMAWINDQVAEGEFSKRDAFCALQGTFRKVENLEPILDILLERNYIREKEISKNGPGRRTKIYEINPLYAISAKYAKSTKKSNFADFADRNTSSKTAAVEPIFLSEIGTYVKGREN
ncbi:YfjI family protein [Syntrophomonas wolfei]|jgi:hypothetical protein|uniref:YfjI family protein n=1 Tax=Syntrophomonas wolfei TaxID=863 RepID=UPI0023F155D6|nr:YfjI family protein [Syntrophomonas wolfei]